MIHLTNYGRKTTCGRKKTKKMKETNCFADVECLTCLKIASKDYNGNKWIAERIFQLKKIIPYQKAFDKLLE